ncbi:MAG: ABC transporter ATP-binding protein [Vulcanimicrobiota bacterium]
MAVLSVQQLSAGHSKPLVSGLSFAVRKGESLALLGPNGGGKTTLLRTLLGLVKPLAGRVELHGKALSGWARQELAQAIAYVPQLASPAFAFTVTEMVLMGRRACVGTFRQPGREDHRIVGDCLEWLAIRHLAARRFQNLSGGERQLVMIARALAQQAEVLVMDEPTASLDFGNQARLLATIQGLKTSGKTLIFSTHHPEQAVQVADRILLLQPGDWHVASPDCLRDTSKLARLYGIGEEVLQALGGQERPQVFRPSSDD